MAGEKHQANLAGDAECDDSWFTSAKLYWVVQDCT